MEGQIINLPRCQWAKSQVSIAYHDLEWGKPIYDDRTLFEFLILEGAQAGLSWETILLKRQNYRIAFDYFDPEIVARYDENRIKELLENPGIVRNRMKIKSTIQNAKAFIRIQQQFGSFHNYIWQFTGGTPKINSWKTLEEIPARTQESDEMSKDLRKRGFSFTGTTICYSFMQAVGMVNDHVVSCFRYKELL